MTDTETPSTLVRVGAWLQFPFSFFIIIMCGWLLWILWPILVDPLFWTAFGWWTLILLGFLVFIGIFGFILAILWLRWRHNITENKRKMITTGIVGMIFTGTIPGLLVLLGAVLFPDLK